MKVILGLACLILVCLMLACSRKKPSPHDGEKLIDCTECSGTGEITYGPDHLFVKDYGYKAGTYVCPMCNGEKKLWSRKL